MKEQYPAGISPYPANYYQDDEIDLFELVAQLWQKKWIIAAFTLFFGVVATLYALFATPVYQADVRVMPPSRSDIAAFNQGAYVDEDLSKYKPEDVFNVFVRHLKFDENLRYSFFKTQYLQYLDDDAKERSEDDLYRQFGERLNVDQVNPKVIAEGFVLSVMFSDAKKSAALRDAFLEQVVDKTKQELRSDIDSLVRAVTQAAQTEIDQLRKQAEVQRQDEITKLSEALSTAKASDLVYPSDALAGNGQSQTLEKDEILLFLLGSKAIEAKLDKLEDRKNNDAFIPELREVESRIAKLKNLNMDMSKARVASYIDVSSVPDEPIKPKRKLIVLIGLLIGLMLGVGYALLSNAIAERKEQQAA